MIRASSKWGLFAASVGVAAWYAIGTMLPPMTVQRVYVHDTVAGKVPEMTVLREIHERFLGQYSGTIVRMDTLEVVCDYQSGQFAYDPARNLPDVVLLDWWVGYEPSCRKAWETPGDYELTTGWRAVRDWFPETWIEAVSLPFTVEEKPK